MCWRTGFKRILLEFRSNKPPWRNRLAHSAVNRKVGGSSPPGDEFLSVLSGESLLGPVKGTSKIVSSFFLSTLNPLDPFACLFPFFMVV